MADEPVGAEPSGADPERVIPPPPADPGNAAGGHFPILGPLAPPLSTPSPPAPSPPLPPYAAGLPTGPPTSGAYPGPAAPGAYPAALPPARSTNRLGIVLAVIGGAVVLAVVGIAAAVGLLLGMSEPPSPSAPTAVADDPSAPAEDPSSDDDPQADDDPESDPAPDADPSGIAERLEAKIDEYQRLRDSGALWQSIPDNEFNRTAVSAFLYLMTDMKVATIWGIDDEQAQEYDERMAMLEERLLAQEPLGDDIKITLEDKVFTYDGETGEGGYTPK